MIQGSDGDMQGWCATMDFPDDERIPEKYRGRRLWVGFWNGMFYVSNDPLHGYAAELARQRYDGSAAASG